MGSEADDGAAREEAAKQHFLAGCQAQGRGELEEAIREYEASLGLVPGIANSLFNLGTCRARLAQDLHGAAAAFEESLRVRPGDVQALLELGDVLRASGDTKGALDALRRAFVLSPERIEAEGIRAVGLQHGGLFGAGEEDLLPQSSALELRRVLREHCYTAASARERLGLKQLGRYTGADFQSMRRGPLPDDFKNDGLGTLLRLFLLGHCIPRSRVIAAGLPLEALEQMGALVTNPAVGALHGTEAADLPKRDSLHPLEEEAEWISAPVQVYPLDARSVCTADAESLQSDRAPLDLLLATDWGVQTFLAAEVCVMQIGFDSLELVRAAPVPGPEFAERRRCLDLCCGSGVQGLAALANGAATEVVSVDLNPRGVRFTLINAELNELGHAVEARLGDLYEALDSDGAQSREVADSERFDMILTNPPFVAVPEHLSGEAWSLFADGGPDGMAVVKRLLEGAWRWLRPDAGWLLLVGEMPNVGRWEWLERLVAEGPAGDMHIFFDPAHTYSAQQYAFDRAGERGGPNARAAALWERQLKDHGVTDISFVLLGARTRQPAGLPRVRVRALQGGDAMRTMSENYPVQLAKELRVAVGLPVDTAAGISNSDS